MIPYYIFLVIIIFFAFLSSKSPKSKILLYVTLAVMVLFAGLRDAKVGTDAAGYARTYSENTRSIEGEWEEQLTKEAGYFYFTQLLGSISREYVVLFIGIAFLTYMCVLTVIRRETKELVVPIFVFVTLGLYTFVFNAARQGIAVGVYMLSFKYLFDNGKNVFLKYSAVVLLAALFHKTVIIALPLFFLFRLQYSPRMLVLIGLIGAGIGAVLPAFLSYAGTLEYRYVLYTTTAGGGEMLTLFYVLITVFFIYWRRKIDKGYLQRYDVYLNMMLFGTLIYVVVQIYGVYIELTRFAAYFQVACIFLWAFIYQSKKKPNSALSVTIIIGHLLFYYIFCSRMANLTPYMLNSNL